MGDPDRSKRKRIRVGNLLPGWVADCDLFFGDTLLITSGTKITTGVIKALKSRDIFFVDVSLNSELSTQDHGLPKVEIMPGLFEDANDIYKSHLVTTSVSPDLLDEATKHMVVLFDAARDGHPEKMEGIRPLVVNLVRQFTARARLAVKLADLPTPEDYLFRHCVNVGQLFMTVAKDWCETEEQLVDRVFAAMLHDIGEIELAPELLNKRGLLTPQEKALFHHHPVLSEELLKSTSASKDARSMVRWHHERMDGSGYPDQLKGNELNRYARLIGICDVYDAVTSTRSYRRKLDFARTIDVLVHDAGIGFDSAIVHHFIKKMGRFPVGTFVRLSTGEVAVVKRVNPAAPWRPLVSVVMDGQGNTVYEPGDIDLSRTGDCFIKGIITCAEFDGADYAETSTGA